MEFRSNIGSPQMVISVAAGEFHRDAENVAQYFGREHLLLPSVGGDAAVAEEDDAADFRDDVGEMVRDEQYADAGDGQLAQDFSKLVLGENVEAVARFV